MTEAKKTWLITGCSSGFGELFVRKLRASGQNVIATGRNAEVKLAHLKDTGAVILDLDVTSPAESIRSTLSEAWDLYPGGIDVLVNNAGYIVTGIFEELQYAMSSVPLPLFCAHGLQGNRRLKTSSKPTSTVL